jgi:hypothetical protein
MDGISICRFIGGIEVFQITQEVVEKKPWQGNLTEIGQRKTQNSLWTCVKKSIRNTITSLLERNIGLIF